VFWNNCNKHLVCPSIAGGAAFNDAPSSKNDDAVGVGDGGKPWAMITQVRPRHAPIDS